MRTCPRCALICPGEASKCDCGFDLAGATPRSIADEARRSRQNAGFGLLAGAFMIVCGLFLGVLAFHAREEQVQLLAFGLCLVGAGGAAIARTLDRLRDLRRSEREARSRLQD
jgi:hypothetical protein